MNNIAKLSEAERRELFSETASQMGVNPVIIEKDFWVCWVLQKIFNDSDLSQKLLFKGGTSLSKVYKVIERFSEDIDLILDWNLITKESPEADRSKSKQEQLNREINNSAQHYILETLKPKLAELLKSFCSVSIDTDDPHCINVLYPKSFSDGYIRPEIRLEVGPLASWLPKASFEITPYVADYFPNLLSDPAANIEVILGKRTFWEKATILHHEANRPDPATQPSRYSRHYYDLAMLSQSPIKEEALADLKLLEDVVVFKQKFYPRGWANYGMAKPGTIKLLPSEEMIKRLKNDYKQMKEMLFGEEVPFEDIMKRIASLEEEINNL